MAKILYYVASLQAPQILYEKTKEQRKKLTQLYAVYKRLM